jgi:hypothetical protein
MSKRSVGIERLEVRLKGIAAESARTAMGGLASELLGQLARQESSGRERIGNVDHLDSGTVRLPSEATPSELRRTIASRIAVSINSTPQKVG